MPSYYVARNGVQSGPFDEQSIVGQMKAGLLSPHDLCSSDGVNEWIELRTLVAASTGSGPMYFHVPASRIVLFSILSCGAYEIYWLYRNWRYIRDQDAAVISPFWRSVFGIFYVRDLFDRIHSDVRARSAAMPSFSPKRLAIAWIVLTILSTLVSHIPSAAATLIAAFIPSFLCLVPVQQYVNVVNRHHPYDPWHTSLGHWACLAFGALVWGLTIVDVITDPVTDLGPLASF